MLYSVLMHALRHPYEGPYKRFIFWLRKHKRDFQHQASSTKTYKHNRGPSTSSASGSHSLGPLLGPLALLSGLFSAQLQSRVTEARFSLRKWGRVWMENRPVFSPPSLPLFPSSPLLSLFPPSTQACQWVCRTDEGCRLVNTAPPPTPPLFFV